ncbi:MAG: dihydrodipicolinate reductase [Lachnospiraceae bacterium]|nr:dihydrodipicolinate reductase [Lachnospiraceae bacterium]
MTLERKEAFQLLEKMPEDKIKLIIQYMQKIEITSEKNDSQVNDSLNALKELQELSGRLPEDFNYEKELQEAMEEKYGYFG